MPSPATSDLPQPKSWEDFEELTADVLKVRWENPHVTRNGRSGQAQNGIDIYGRAKHLGGLYSGAQCKKYKDGPDLEMIKAAVVEAEGFVPTLGEFLFVTSAQRDSKLQQSVRILSSERTAASKFPVEILFWEDLCNDLSGNSNLLKKHFPGWAGLLETEPEIAVRWALDDQSHGTELKVGQLAPQISSMESQFRRFDSSEIKYLRETSPEEAQIVSAYITEANRCLGDTTLRQRWLDACRRKRFKEGHRARVSISVDRAPAHELIVTLRFPLSLEVYEEGRPPKDSPCPDLPRRPQLKSEGPSISKTFEKLRLDYAFPNYEDLEWGQREPLKFIHPTANWTSSVSSPSRAVIRAKKGLLRRTFTLSDDDLLVIAPVGDPGTYIVSWTADAENLRAPVHGELTVVVEPSPGTKTDPEAGYIGPPMVVRAIE